MESLLVFIVTIQNWDFSRKMRFATWKHGEFHWQWKCGTVFVNSGGICHGFQWKIIGILSWAIWDFTDLIKKSWEMMSYDERFSLSNNDLGGFCNNRGEQFKQLRILVCGSNVKIYQHALERQDMLSKGQNMTKHVAQFLELRRGKNRGVPDHMTPLPCLLK